MFAFILIHHHRARQTKYRGSGATRKVAEMLKFPRKEEGKKEKETERRGKEGKERRGERGKKGRVIKGQNWLVYWERRRKFIKRNEGILLATRKKNIFWALHHQLILLWTVAQ